METITVTFRAHPSLVQACSQAAEAQDETLSQVLRRAMRDYIAAHAQPDLPLKPIGRPRKPPIFSGPADRSKNQGRVL
jgi:hypothetical protein